MRTILTIGKGIENSVYDQMKPSYHSEMWSLWIPNQGKSYLLDKFEGANLMFAELLLLFIRHEEALHYIFLGPVFLKTV